MVEQIVFIDELKYKIKYRLTSMKKSIDEWGIIDVFGITVFQEGYEDSEEEHLCSSIEDISSNEEFVRKIFDIISLHTVLPIHMRDIVEDLILL